ncbi:MAG TPA: class I SAM-dependent methyltransferase [Flavobacterium sp.]|jgi:ubiquinone/menaquinone biosynthesis C-methylase UbiE
MKADFDEAAASYDSNFTDSFVGRMQRNIVLDHLQELLRDKGIRKVLEINCGTGEDALWLEKQNLEVTATDISEKMIEVAKSKMNHSKVIFKQADINSLSESFAGEKFDLILSNFGGLNCLRQEQINNFFQNSASLLTDTGKMLLVIMPKNTIWEQFYFLMKGNAKSAFRRKQGSAQANVSGSTIPTYYYNPGELAVMASAHFKLIKTNPVGFFVPPSYLDPHLKNRRWLASLLGRLDTAVKNFSILAQYADHYSIILSKK